MKRRTGQDTGLPVLSRLCCAPNRAANGHKTVEFMLAGRRGLGFWFSYTVPAFLKMHKVVAFCTTLR